MPTDVVTFSDTIGLLTFTSLSSHTSTSGHTWSPGPSATTSSAGKYTSGSNSPSGYTFPSAPFVSMVISPGSAISTWWAEIGSWDGSTRTGTVRVQFQNTGAITTVRLNPTAAVNTGTTIASWSGTPSTMPSPTTIRFEQNLITVNGTPYTVTGGPVPGDQLLLSIVNNASPLSGGALTSSISAGYVIPDPPSLFWTSLVNTVEVAG